MVQTLRTWKAIYYVHLLESLAYPANWIIWVLTDAVNCFAMPIVFAAASGGAAIQGFSRPDFFAYYLALLMITSFVLCHLMWEIAWEVKEGTFSAQLVRPISYYQWTFVRNLSWRLTRLMMTVPIALLMILVYREHLSFSQFHFIPQFWVALVLGNMVSFSVAVAFGMVALFLTEAQSVFELYYVPMLFLSGAMFPIALLPPWAQSLAKVFPFFYTTGLPTEIVIGRISGGQAWGLILGQIIWIGLAYGFFRFAWKKGLRQYSGVGM